MPFMTFALANPFFANISISEKPLYDNFLYSALLL